MTQRREYKVYYESELSLGIAIGPEVIPHGAEVFRVREVLPSDGKGPVAVYNSNVIRKLRERNAKLLNAAKDCLELLEDWFPLIDDMRCASEIDSKKIDRLQAAVRALTESEVSDERV